MNNANKDTVIVVDKFDNKIGTTSLNNSHRKGLLHRVVIVYLTNKNGQILIQERISGRLDHSSAGHVNPNESYSKAAKRELKEELGVKCKLSVIGKAISDEIEPETDGNRVRHIYKIFECQAEPNDLAKDEVKSVFWADPKIIFKEMENDPGNHIFCGGFKSSLKFYLSKKHQLPLDC